MDFSSIEILEKSFEGIIFSEKDHTYIINNSPAKSSVTQLLKKYEKPFDTNKIAAVVAAKQGVLVEDIKNLWEFKKNFSCEKGTLFHSYVENFLQKKKIQLNKQAISQFVYENIDYVTEQQFYTDVAHYISNFQNFYNYWKQDHILIRPELVVGDEETKVCGCIDNLSFNTKTKELVIFDYKTNKEIKTVGRERLLSEMSHLTNCELVKYSLQLWLYNLILERNTPFKLADPYIVWVGKPNSYELIQALDLRKEAEMILKLAV
jgi:ATP-dependent exoDNAse (exonuclease V) beta subunit